MIDKDSPLKNSFRLRGLETTRLETFMDAAFAFAITMLVISLGELPQNYPELIISLKEIPAFLSSFSVIMIFWLSHRSWSRRYGLEDRITIFLSISLIFILLVYLYPLRLIFSSLFTGLSKGWFPSNFEIKTYSELLGLYAIYGFGLFAIAGLMCLLYLRVYSKKNELQLNDFEIFKTKNSMSILATVSLTGFIAAILALTLPQAIALQTVYLYITIPISVTLIKRFYKKYD